MSRLPEESQAQATKLFCAHDFYYWRLAFRCCFHPQVLANLLPRLPYCYDWGWVFRGSLVLYSAPMTCAIFLILGLTYWLDLWWQDFDQIRYRIVPGVLPHSSYDPISLPCFSYCCALHLSYAVISFTHCGDRCRAPSTYPRALSAPNPQHTICEPTTGPYSPCTPFL